MLSTSNNIIQRKQYTEIAHISNENFLEYWLVFTV